MDLRPCSLFTPLKTSQGLLHTFEMNSPVHIHSPKDVANALQSHRPLRLAPDGNTYTGCFLPVSNARGRCQHEYWASVLLQISAFKTPGHSHYRCDGIEFRFCCTTSAEQDSLVRGATAQTQNLLDTVYPQLSCDLFKIPSFVRPHNTPSLVQGDLETDLSNATPRQNLPLPASSVNFESLIKRTAEALSKNISSRTLSACPDTKQLIQYQQSLDQYTDWALSLADSKRSDLKTIKEQQYVLRFTAGTIQQFQVASGDVSSAVLDIEPPDRSTSKTRRRWEAIATILNAVVAALLPIWGLDAYQIYQAAIAGRCRLSRLVDAKRDQWVTLGRNIAQQLERPKSLPKERSVFDPVFLACKIARRSYADIRDNVRALPNAPGLELLHEAPPGSNEVFDHLGLLIEEHDKAYDFDSTDSSDSLSETQSSTPRSVTPQTPTTSNALDDSCADVEMPISHNARGQTTETPAEIHDQNFAVDSTGRTLVPMELLHETSCDNWAFGTQTDSGSEHQQQHLPGSYSQAPGDSIEMSGHPIQNLPGFMYSDDPIHSLPGYMFDDSYSIENMSGYMDDFSIQNLSGYMRV